MEANLKTSQSNSQVESRNSYKLSRFNKIESLYGKSIYKQVIALPYHARRLLNAILYFRDKFKSMYFSQEYLAKILSICRKTVNKWLGLLVGIGLIISKRRRYFYKFQTNIYSVNPKFFESSVARVLFPHLDSLRNLAMSWVKPLDCPDLFDALEPRPDLRSHVAVTQLIKDDYLYYSKGCLLSKECPSILEGVSTTKECTYLNKENPSARAREESNKGNEKASIFVDRPPESRGTPVIQSNKFLDNFTLKDLRELLSGRRE